MLIGGVGEWWNIMKKCDVFCKKRRICEKYEKSL